MKKEIKLIFKIILIIITSIIIGYILHLFFMTFLKRTDSKYLTNVLVNGGLIIYFILLIKKEALAQPLGLNKVWKMDHFTAFMVPLLLFGIFFIPKLYSFFEIHFLIVIAFIFKCILVGTLEELMFRGLLLSLIVKLNRMRNNSIFIGVLISSVLFSLAHFINLFEKPLTMTTISLVTSQVILAFCFGVFLCGVFFRTGNIICCIVLHAFFNLTFESEFINKSMNIKVNEEAHVVTSFYDLLPTLIIFSIFLISGILMIKYSNTKEFINKLTNELN